MNGTMKVLEEIRDLLKRILELLGDTTKRGEEDPPPKPPGEPG